MNDEEKIKLAKPASAETLMEHATPNRGTDEDINAVKTESFNEDEKKQLKEALAALLETTNRVVTIVAVPNVLERKGGDNQFLTETHIAGTSGKFTLESMEATMVVMLMRYMSLRRGHYELGSSPMPPDQLMVEVMDAIQNLVSGAFKTVFEDLSKDPMSTVSEAKLRQIQGKVDGLMGRNTNRDH